MREQAETLRGSSNSTPGNGYAAADASERLGVLREVYDRWERDERAPVVSVWPSIIAFLGYYPVGVAQVAQTLSAWLVGSPGSTKRHSPGE